MIAIFFLSEIAVYSLNPVWTAEIYTEDDNGFFFIETQLTWNSIDSKPSLTHYLKKNSNDSTQTQLNWLSITNKNDVLNSRIKIRQVICRPYMSISIQDSINNILVELITLIAQIVMLPIAIAFFVLFLTGRIDSTKHRCVILSDQVNQDYVWANKFMFSKLSLYWNDCAVWHAKLL